MCQDINTEVRSFRTLQMMVKIQVYSKGNENHMTENYKKAAQKFDGVLSA